MLQKLKDINIPMKCACIGGGISLKVNHTQEELNEFLKKMDFRYNNGYGSQELYGTVWLVDGTWLSRRVSYEVYNECEWWEHKGT